MIDFLSSEDFRFLWLPIITTVLTILIKFFYKDRRLNSVTWADFSVAPNLMITALFIFVIKMSLYAAQIKSTPELVTTNMDSLITESLVLGGMMVGIFASMWLIKERGWKENYLGQLQLKRKAIIFSDIVGVVYLFIAYNF